jgi:hypothetical protein
MVEMMENNDENAFNVNARSRAPRESSRVDRRARAPSWNEEDEEDEDEDGGGSSSSSSRFDVRDGTTPPRRLNDDNDDEMTTTTISRKMTRGRMTKTVATMRGTCNVPGKEKNRID